MKRSFCHVLIFALSAVSSVDAQEHSPKVCVGFNHSINSWGLSGSSLLRNQNNCPANHAWFAVVTGLKRRVASGAEFVSLDGNCCPLPSSDILLDEHIDVKRSCPEGYIATGARLERIPSSCGVSLSAECLEETYGIRTRLRCTRVNSERYTLGPQSAGLRMSLSNHFRQSREPRISRSSIFAAIRYGVGRVSHTSWASRVCVGDPQGALLVGRDDKRCSKIWFRKLRYRGIEGDPPEGTPVKMFPTCFSISDPLDPEAVCLR